MKEQITIDDYFNKKNKGIRKFCSDFPENETASTVEEFYWKFIQKTEIDKTKVCDWHRMLVEYISHEDAIFLCRLYESGGEVFKFGKNDKTGNDIKFAIDQTRRATKTIVGNVPCLFVSNYDAAEFCNMVSKGVVADVNLFKDMLKNYKYRLHYQASAPISKEEYEQLLENNELEKRCKELLEQKNKKSLQEEAYILAGYPKIGNVRSSILNSSKRYLAHIIGVKDVRYYFEDKKDFYQGNINEILPRGKISDWKDENGKCVRIIKRDLSEEDKRVIKAHFLRFFDPVNYFVTPSNSYHSKDSNMGKNRNIGEYWLLQQYVEKRYEELYGKDVMDEFRRLALVPKSEDDKYKKIIRNGESIYVNSITYGTNLKTKKK